MVHIDRVIKDIEGDGHPELTEEQRNKKREKRLRYKMNKANRKEMESTAESKF